MKGMRFSFRRHWERVRTVPGLGRDVTALAVLVVAGVAAAGVIQGNATTAAPWEDRALVKAEFEQVPGVNPKSSHVVTMAGVRVGKIADWEVTERGTAVLTLDIEEGHPIYENARAVLRPKNPLNEMQVEINPGAPPAQQLPDGGLIPASQTVRPIQADEVLSHLDARTQQAVTDLLVESDTALVRAPQDLPRGLSAADGALNGLRPVVEALETRRKHLSTLVSSLSDIAAAAGDNDARLAKLADSAQQTLGVLASNDRSLRRGLEELPGLGVELRRALTRTQDLTEQLNPTLDNLRAASDVLPKALRELRGTVDALDGVVKDAGPLVQKAKPVVADLRPLAGDLDGSLRDLRPVTRNLDRDTGIVSRYRDDIAAFVYNTASVFGAGDTKETGIIRGHFTLALPDGGFLPGGRGGWAPTPEESGTQGDNR